MYVVCINTNGQKTYETMPSDKYDDWIQANPSLNIEFVFDDATDLIAIENSKQNTFDIYCEYYGFEPTDLHRKFVSNAGYTQGHVCEFTGILPKNRKYKCRILDTFTNKTYKVTQRFLHEMLDNHSI